MFHIPTNTNIKPYKFERITNAHIFIHRKSIKVIDVYLNGHQFIQIKKRLFLGRKIEGVYSMRGPRYMTNVDTYIYMNIHINCIHSYQMK